MKKNYAVCCSERRSDLTARDLKRLDMLNSGNVEALLNSVVNTYFQVVTVYFSSRMRDGVCRRGNAAGYFSLFSLFERLALCTLKDFEARPRA